MDNNVFSKCLISHKGILHVDWGKFYKLAEDRLSDHFVPFSKEWDTVLEFWLTNLSDSLNQGHLIYESENCFYLSTCDKSDASRILASAEKSISLIRQYIPISNFDKWRIVIIAMSDFQDYLNYLDFYSKSSELSDSSSGTFVSTSGYQHLLLRPNESMDFERTLAHELSHYHLAVYPIPLWLDEGIAVNMEKQIFGEDMYLSKEEIENYKKIWNSKKNIEMFLNGEAFEQLDADYVYGLSELLVRKLIRSDQKKFYSLIESASCEDGGKSAFREIYGMDIEETIQEFLR